MRRDGDATSSAFALRLPQTRFLACAAEAPARKVTATADPLPNLPLFCWTEAPGAAGRRATYIRALPAAVFARAFLRLYAGSSWRLLLLGYLLFSTTCSLSSMQYSGACGIAFLLFVPRGISRGQAWAVLPVAEDGSGMRTFKR